MISRELLIFKLILSCRSWRLAGLPDRNRQIGIGRIPGLILPSSRTGGKFVPLTDIINNHNDNENNNNLVIPWQLAERSLCIGSFRGWILVLDETSSKMTMLNPVTDSEFALPEYPSQRIIDLEFLRRESNRFHKVKIWAPHHSASVSDWYVFALPRDMSFLTYCRVGDGEWQVVAFPECEIKDFTVDALHSSSLERCLYVLTSTGELLWCHLEKKMTTRMTTRAVAASSSLHRRSWLSLVEVQGEALMIHRSRVSVSYTGAKVHLSARKFDVYRLDREGKQWVEIKEFRTGGRNCAVFIGFRQPFSALAEPELGIKENCIYSMDSYDSEASCIISVFDLTTSSFSCFDVDSELETETRVRQQPVPVAPVPW